MSELSKTEMLNENTRDIDLQDSLGIVSLINQEDLKVAQEVSKVLPEIARAVDLIQNSFLNGGRLLYFGAGTSGRLGVLDASECPPTFNTEKEMVQGIIAGGDEAIKNAIEGAEDSVELAQKDFSKLNISPSDSVVVISASGNANYVVEILRLAKEIGCSRISVTSNPKAKIKENTNCFICVETGAEAVCGSTRLKAGTAQKMVLNMLTTASMIKIGKVYKNYMIDLKPTNIKLKQRAARFVSEIADIDLKKTEESLEKANYRVKQAVLISKYSLTLEEANLLLDKHNGVLRKALKELES